jgi:hypothetical protein
MIYFNYRHFQTIQTILKHKLCVNIHDWSLCVNIIFGDIFQKIFQFMCIYIAFEKYKNHLLEI